MKKFIFVLFFIFLYLNVLFGQKPMPIYAFPGPASPGGNYTTLVNANVVSGPVIEFGWNTIDTDGVPADFSWTAHDARINNFLNTYAGSTIIVQYAPASDLFTNSFTPSYVWQANGMYMCQCPQYAGSGTYPNNGTSCDTNPPDGTGVPVPFAAPMITYWSQFIQQAILHDQGLANASKIKRIIFGRNRGGEDYPTCYPQEQTIISPPQTLAHLLTLWQGMDATYDGVIYNNNIGTNKFQIVSGVACIGNAQYDPTGANNCSFADGIAATHIQYNVGLRFTSIVGSDINNYAGNAPTAADWVALSLKYPNAAIDLQYGVEAGPTGTCNAKSVPLNQIQPFLNIIERQNSNVILEATLNDLYGTYVAGFLGGPDTCWPNGTSTPYQPYAQINSNTLLGLPYSTLLLTGKQKLSGNSVSH